MKISTEDGMCPVCGEPVEDHDEVDRSDCLGATKPDGGWS